MRTTIQVSRETLELLRRMKDREGLPSYDSVIQKLIKDAMKSERSAFGMLGKRSMDEILEGLRDEEDKI
ncbi:MAG TPA: hypothetical protein ENI32_01175 [Candidatus Syntrophoarchaeum butanivorans]|uniref:Ribbon-helix-helix protein, CopG family n=1 Tax=Candidatus Syntropharchaeum butanivorans TaxID=1839936 RepID=A0A1F2P4E8_9EURY|nr:MAG: hypothetical protein SBU_001271 [Candidatus Syntrophoarchaeum butanivorans]HEC56488.1 hypothetical protein [Candidatus Syntrophoarchaeum butanivorans]